MEDGVDEGVALLEDFVDGAVVEGGVWKGEDRKVEGWEDGSGGFDIEVGGFGEGGELEVEGCGVEGWGHGGVSGGLMF